MSGRIRARGIGLATAATVRREGDEQGNEKQAGLEEHEHPGTGSCGRLPVLAGREHANRAQEQEELNSIRQSRAQLLWLRTIARPPTNMSTPDR